MRFAPRQDASQPRPSTGPFAHLARVAVRAGWIALGSAWVLGCSAEAGGADEVAATSEHEIYGGTPDTSPSSAVVAIKVAGRASGDLCSGALVAPNLVLTARHCVAKMAATAVVCDENGESRNGRHVSGPLDPSSLSVFVGSAVDFRKGASAKGAQIVEPPGDTLCSADLALVVLDRAIPGVTPFKVRVSDAPRVGEGIRSVGYGKTDAAVPVGTRMNRQGVPILAVGSGVSASRTPLGPREFEVGLSACHGDSGGPAVSEETGAIVGVVSRGSDCQADFGHVYTTTRGFAALIAEGAAAAGTAVADEAGGAVHAEADADFAPVEGAAAGSDDTAAPDAPASAGAAGCSASPSGKVDGGVALGFGVALVAAARRRRRA